MYTKQVERPLTKRHNSCYSGLEMQKIIGRMTNNLYEPWPVSSTVLCGELASLPSLTLAQGPFPNLNVQIRQWNKLTSSYPCSQLNVAIRRTFFHEYRANYLQKSVTCLLILAKSTTALESAMALFRAFLYIQRDQGAPLSQRYRLPRLENEETARERPRKKKCTALNNKQTAMLLPKDAMQIRPVQLQTKEFIRNTRAGSYWARVLCRYAFVLSRPKQKIPTRKRMKSGRWSQTGRRAKQK